MANQLREWIQRLVTKVGLKLGKAGVINASNLESELDKIVTSEEAEKTIKGLLSGEGIENLIIPNGTTKLRSYAIADMAYNASLNIYIPKTVTTLGPTCVQGSSYAANFWEVEFEDASTITSIGSNAFTGKIKGDFRFPNVTTFSTILNDVVLDGTFYITPNMGPAVSKTYIFRGKTQADISSNIVIEEGITNFSTKSTVCSYVYYGYLSIPTTLTYFRGYNFDNCGFSKVYIKDLEKYFVNCSVGTGPNYDTEYEGRYYPFRYATLYVNNEPVYELDLSQFTNSTKTSLSSNFAGFNFTKVKLNKKLITISACFAHCPNLESVDMSMCTALTTISDCSFYNTLKLTYLEIPSSVTKIGAKALQCGTTANKATFKILATVPFTIAADTFNASTLNKIFVPATTSGAFKEATNWSNFADYIIEPNNITFNVDSSLLNNENVLYSIDGGEEQQFTQTSFTGRNLATLKVTSKTADITVLVGTTQGGSEIGTVANASTVFTFESDTTIYITKQ